MDIKKKQYDYNTNAVSESQFNEHMKLYEGYIKKTNEISNILMEKPDEQGANAVYSKFRELKKEQTFALDGVILHEEYFKNMTKQNLAPGPSTQKLINHFFGSYENWKKDFTATATSARGWCITAYDQRTRTVQTFLQDAHDCGAITMAYPIIVIDMYEHAYFLDYGTDKETYIKKFILSINWDVVESKSKRVLNLII